MLGHLGHHGPQIDIGGLQFHSLGSPACYLEGARADNVLATDGLPLIHKSLLLDRCILYRFYLLPVAVQSSYYLHNFNPHKQLAMQTYGMSRLSALITGKPFIVLTLVQSLS